MSGEQEETQEDPWSSTRGGANDPRASHECGSCSTCSSNAISEHASCDACGDLPNRPGSSAHATSPIFPARYAAATAYLCGEVRPALKKVGYQEITRDVDHLNIELPVFPGFPSSGGRSIDLSPLKHDGRRMAETRTDNSNIHWPSLRVILTPFNTLFSNPRDAIGPASCVH